MGIPGRVLSSEQSERSPNAGKSDPIYQIPRKPVPQNSATAIGEHNLTQGLTHQFKVPRAIKMHLAMLG